MSYPAIIVCNECGWFGAGIVYDDQVVPTGVRTCPGCGEEKWREFGGDGGWPSEK